MNQLDPWDQALLAALDEHGGGHSLDELAASSGISLPLLEALAREGLLIPHGRQPEVYDPADIEAVKAGLELVEAGLPLGELFDLARSISEAMRPVAQRAVEVFASFIRDSIEEGAATEEAAADRLVRAFQAMLPAAGRLVDHHFRRLLVAEARRRLTEP